MTTTEESLTRFKALVNAALTLGLAGLAGGPAAVKLCIPGGHFEFQVPYTEGRKVVLVEAPFSRRCALRRIITKICEKSGAIAPCRGFSSIEFLETRGEPVHFVGPREASAHEVMQANALLAEALAQWGSKTAHIAKLLA